MDINFTTEKYPSLNLNFTVKPKLFGLNIELRQNGELIEPTEKKKFKYSIELEGENIWLLVEPSALNSKIHIGSDKFDFGPKINWYDYVIGGIPFVLVVSGGAIGAVFGYIGWTANMNYIKYETSWKKYLNVGIITICSTLIILTIGVLVKLILKKMLVVDFTSN